MARLLTHPLDSAAGVSGTQLTLDTARKIEGTGSLRAIADTGFLDLGAVPNGVAGRSYYFRLYMYVEAFPAVDWPFRVLTFKTADGGSLWGFVIQLTNSGRIEARDANFVRMFQSADPIPFNQWNYVEGRVKVNIAPPTDDDEYEMKLNGTTIFNAPPANYFFGNSPGGWRLGSDFADYSAYNDGRLIVNYDAFAVNDDQGATDNSWVGPLALPPAAPASRLAMLI